MTSADDTQPEVATNRSRDKRVKFVDTVEGGNEEREDQ